MARFSTLKVTISDSKLSAICRTRGPRTIFADASVGSVGCELHPLAYQGQDMYLTRLMVLQTNSQS